MAGRAGADSPARPARGPPCPAVVAQRREQPSSKRPGARSTPPAAPTPSRPAVVVRGQSGRLLSGRAHVRAVPTAHPSPSLFASPPWWNGNTPDLHSGDRGSDSRRRYEPSRSGVHHELRTLSGVAEREGARLLTESTWVRAPPPELSPSGRVAEGGRLQSGRAIVPHGCESRLGVHVDVAQWPERCVADAADAGSIPVVHSKLWPAGEVLVVAHLASTQDERVRFPPPALDGTVAQ